MSSFDLKSIKGAELQTLATEIAKVILSDGSVLAQALASLDARVRFVENASTEIGNAGLGERGLVPLITSTTSESENCAATPKSVKTAYDSLNSSKQNKLTTAQQSAVDSGITSSKRSSYDTHIADAGIHVTDAQKEVWDGKADKNGDYPLMSVGVSEGASYSTSVVDYNDSNKQRIKIGEAGKSLDSCTYLAAYTTLSGGSVAIKNIHVDNVEVGKSKTATTAISAGISNSAAQAGNSDKVDYVHIVLDGYDQNPSNEHTLRFF